MGIFYHDGLPKSHGLWGTPDLRPERSWSMGESGAGLMQCSRPSCARYTARPSASEARDLPLSF